MMGRFLQNLCRIFLVLLLATIGAGSAGAAPSNRSQTELAILQQSIFAGNTDPTNPLALSGKNIGATDGLITDSGNFRALGGAKVLSTSLNFSRSSNAPNGTVELPGGVSVQGRPVNPSHAPEASTPRYEVSPAQAERYLRDMGGPDQQATSFVQSFDGPIYIRETRVGETFGTCSSPGSTNTAQFLTPDTAGQTPGQVVDNLALPDSNHATNFNAATINQPIGVLEGVIAPQNWTGSNPLPGGGWQVFVPGGSQFGTAPVTIGGSLQ